MAFIFDAEAGETPETIARQREIAAMLLGQGPVASPNTVGGGIGNALASLAGGFAAGSLNRGADAAQTAGREGANSLFQQLVGGIANGTPITGAPAAPSGQPNDMSAYQNAISGIESGGRYDAVGPSHPKLGRALGKYQVMEANVGPWSQTALGRAVSPEEFLANPQIQDAVFNSQFGQYVKQYGPQGAAQAWFAGPGGIGTNRQDSLGTSVPEYTAKFNAGLGQGGARPVVGTLPSTGRPMLANADGSVSTEESITVTDPRLNGGAPTNIPSIWGGQRLGDEDAVTAALTSWQRFQAYPDIPSAEAAARARSARLGTEVDSLLPANAQPTQGAAPQQPPQMQGGPSMQQIMQVLSNPWSTPQQRSVAEMLLKQQMEAQDPMRQLQMRRLQQQVDNPGSDENFYGNPVPVQNPDGSISYGQIGNRGTFKPINLGEGQKFAPPTKTIDAGTETIIVDQAGNVISRQPKNLAGAEAAKVQGKAQGEAQVNLPTDIANADRTVTQIDQLLANNGLDSILGPFDQFRPSWTMGAEGRDALARYKQLQGRAFLEAYGILRGGGQVTEVEGAKAQDAMARLDRAQDEETFKVALRDFRDAVQTGLQKMRERAGTSASASGGPAAPPPPAGQPTTDYRSKYGLE